MFYLVVFFWRGGGGVSFFVVVFFVAFLEVEFCFFSGFFGYLVFSSMTLFNRTLRSNLKEELAHE